MSSRIESLIWSAILSGWPSVTDSEVNSLLVITLSLRWRSRTLYLAARTSRAESQIRCAS